MVQEVFSFTKQAKDNARKVAISTSLYPAWSWPSHAHSGTLVVVGVGGLVELDNLVEVGGDAVGRVVVDVDVGVKGTGRIAPQGFFYF